MPVAAISRSCRWPIQFLPSREAWRSASRSGSITVAENAAFLHGEWRIIHKCVSQFVSECWHFANLHSAADRVGRDPPGTPPTRATFGALQASLAPTKFNPFN